MIYSDFEPSVVYAILVSLFTLLLVADFLRESSQGYRPFMCRVFASSLGLLSVTPWVLYTHGNPSLFTLEGFSVWIMVLTFCTACLVNTLTSTDTISIKEYT